MSMLLYPERVLSLRRSAVGTETGYGQVSRGVTVSHGADKTILLIKPSKPVPGSTQHSIQWAVAVLPPEIKLTVTSK
jgi:hypothetical protein